MIVVGVHNSATLPQSSFVGTVRLELTIPCSQSRCAGRYATLRQHLSSPGIATPTARAGYERGGTDQMLCPTTLFPQLRDTRKR